MMCKIICVSNELCINNSLRKQLRAGGGANTTTEKGIHGIHSSSFAYKYAYKGIDC